MQVKLGKKIGSGSYGNVYEVQGDPDHAVKIIPMNEDDRGIPCLLEAIIMSSLFHPGLVSAIDVYARDEDLVVFMEKGVRDLGYRMLNELPTETMLEVAYRLISAVAFLHESRILHGDIKGSNILIFTDGTVRLTDYTLSRVVKERFFSRISYTVTHRAPEVFEKKWSFPADIFALGCTFHEIFCGNRIFWQDREEDWRYLHSYYQFSNTFFGTNYKHRMGVDIARPNRSHPLWKIIQPMLHPSPQKRPTARDLLESPVFASCKPLTGIRLTKDIGFSPSSDYHISSELRETFNHLELITRTVPLTHPEERENACSLLTHKIHSYIIKNMEVSPSLHRTEIELCNSLRFQLMM